MKCGKALNEKKADIRIQFKPLEHDIFGNYERYGKNSNSFFFSFSSSMLAVNKYTELH